MDKWSSEMDREDKDDGRSRNDGVTVKVAMNNERVVYDPGVLMAHFTVNISQEGCACADEWRGREGEAGGVVAGRLMVLLCRTAAAQHLQMNLFTMMRIHITLPAKFMPLQSLVHRTRWPVRRCISPALTLESTKTFLFPLCILT
ncbi:hypothetical protein E2C01_060089 [Portunus trituberculatus]|uniref:Uncharacterized protein n=1 Tax=Portunus trituberculatus TaxID=210409 RepID=A0A5B7H7X4_PORTR|nr:hypothetical protein [Portunus trituberculatus]